MITKFFKIKEFNITLITTAMVLASCQEAPVSEAQPTSEPLTTKQESASYKRFREGKIRYEKYNEFNTKFDFVKLEGFEFDQGVERYYPSSIIQDDEVYYMWYSKPLPNSEVVGPNDATETKRAFHWDLSEVWYATSTDGYTWEEQGVAIERGAEGRHDHRSVFNPEILVANDKYYVIYQAASSKDDARWSKHSPRSGDFAPNTIGMSVSDSPNGPWTALDEPILSPGAEDAWDGEVVHEPTFIVKDGKYYLYYKSQSRLPWTANISPGEFNKEHADVVIAMGVAIANNPEGPYVRSELNPVLMGGHGTTVWPHGSDVCAMFPEGPERNSILCAEDGINFYPVSQGLTNLPWGGAAFRKGKFADIDEQPGEGLSWGVSHLLDPYYHFVRFESDMTVEKREQVSNQHQLIQEYRDSDGYNYDPSLDIK